MSNTKRKRYSTEFKAKAALDAIRGEQTLSEPTTIYDLHPNMINTWKCKAIENMALKKLLEANKRLDTLYLLKGSFGQLRNFKREEGLTHCCKTVVDMEADHLKAVFR